MDCEDLVRLAAGGDIRAFVALMRRFQQAAFGSALALVHDFGWAEDVVQEAFFAAWAGLPTLADPAAFPGWLRAIVRHHAFRVLRRKQLSAVPLTEAKHVPAEEPGPIPAEPAQASARRRRCRPAKISLTASSTVYRPDVFYFSGGLDEIRANIGRELKFGPVRL